MLRLLTRPKLAALLLSLGILAEYALLPLYLRDSEPQLEATAMALLSAIAVAGIILGAYFPVLSLPVRLAPIRIPLNALTALVWVPFLLFVALAFATADRIPILASLHGASTDDLAVMRENFLKARAGWQSSFVYISAVLTGSLLPYTVAQLFLHKSRLRWPCLLILLFYSVSFLEKAYFLRSVLPFLYLTAHKKIRIPFSTSYLMAAILAILLTVTIAARTGREGVSDRSQFFNVAYVPSGSADFLLWRAMAVPVLTTSDSLKVFDDKYDGHYFSGATSSLIASLTGRERVLFERDVFESEWGQNETETGSANAPFFTEAFVNFGYVGVLLISVLAGVILRKFYGSGDEAFRALCPLFCFGLFVSGFIGLLFSNGFLLLLLLVSFAKIEPGPAREQSSSIV